MTQDWPKKILQKWRWQKNSQKHEKDIINAYVNVENLS
jgi:hypothetical protein